MLDAIQEGNFNNRHITVAKEADRAIDTLLGLAKTMRNLQAVQRQSMSPEQNAKYQALYNAGPVAGFMSKFEQLKAEMKDVADVILEARTVQENVDKYGIDLASLLYQLSTSQKL
ncbi:MAG: hypothetical protein Alis3KO_01100 [Aliiglaciecola sp.]